MHSYLINRKQLEILGITLERNMNFLVEKQVKKLSALLRISPLYKSMMKSHSNCCQLDWMFCSGQSNNLINKGHERGPKLTYRAETKDFQQIRNFYRK